MIAAGLGVVDDEDVERVFSDYSMTTKQNPCLS